VHSEDASIADRLSQRPGHFEKTLKGIRNSIDSGMHVTINSTINSLNCRRLPMFADFMTRSFPEVRHYVFNNLDPGKADGRLRSRAGDNQWVVARLVDFEIELKAALDLLAAKGKTFRVERVPLCYMQGYEEFSTETRKIVKGEKYMCMFLEYGGGKNLRVVAPSSRRVKSDACKACGLESVCAGLDSGYAKIHGVGEIYPVFYDPEWVGVRVKKNE
jgi:MoaA/NifB/PqqE/SkfB family radical SAM enzyme